MSFIKRIIQYIFLRIFDSWQMNFSIQYNRCFYFQNLRRKKVNWNQVWKQTNKFQCCKACSTILTEIMMTRKRMTKKQNQTNINFQCNARITFRITYCVFIYRLLERITAAMHFCWMKRQVLNFLLSLIYTRNHICYEDEDGLYWIPKTFYVR